MCLMNFCQQPGTVSCYALTATVRFDPVWLYFSLSSASSADAPQRDGSSWKRRRDDNADNFSILLDKAVNLIK